MIFYEYGLRPHVYTVRTCMHFLACMHELHTCIHVHVLCLLSQMQLATPECKLLFRHEVNDFFQPQMNDSVINGADVHVYMYVHHVWGCL